MQDFCTELYKLFQNIISIIRKQLNKGYNKLIKNCAQEKCVQEQEEVKAAAQ